MISGKIVYPNGLGREHPFINDKTLQLAATVLMETIVPTSAVKIVFRWQCAIKYLERVENAKMGGTVISAMKVSSSLKKSIYKIVCD